MAQFETSLRGDFAEILSTIHSEVLKSGTTASLAGSSSFNSQGVRCAVRVYERYSLMENSPVSLNITLIDDGRQIFLSAITAGGNTIIAMNNFLKVLQKSVARYQA